MSAQISMMLGGFAFDALDFGFQNINRRLQTPWAKISVAQSFDQQQWTGPTSDQITIRGVVFPVAYGGQSELEGLSAAASSGTPMMLVTGDEFLGTIQGIYTIQSIDEDRSDHTGFGVAQRNAYSISLDRYGEDAAGVPSLLSPIINLFG